MKKIVVTVTPVILCLCLLSLQCRENRDTDSNFFDEYISDRDKAGITQNDYKWSSDSFVISSVELPNAAHVKIFQDKMSYYISCSELKPTFESFKMENGVLNIRTTIPIHGVVLYEISLN